MHCTVHHAVISPTGTSRCSRGERPKGPGVGILSASILGFQFGSLGQIERESRDHGNRWRASRSIGALKRRR